MGAAPFLAEAGVGLILGPRRSGHGFARPARHNDLDRGRAGRPTPDATGDTDAEAAYARRRRGALLLICH
jgi:hypothetical protein